MNETTTIKPKRRLKFLKVLLVLVACFIIVRIGYRAWYRHEYPYGSSHACSKGLGLALRFYAGDHEDWLPHGEAAPETSLSLLYQNDESATWFLGGKNIPTKVVEAELIRDGLLKPESCGWHYIEGLKESDDPQVVVAWDKTRGLDHNGKRRSGLEHEVVLLDGSTQYIPTAKWSQFLTE